MDQWHSCPHFAKMTSSQMPGLPIWNKGGYIKKHVKGSDSSYAGDYEVTGSGYAVLVDYFESRKKSLKIFLLTDVFIPAIIAFLTVIFTSYIQ